MKLKLGDTELLDLPDGTYVERHEQYPVIDPKTGEVIYTAHHLFFRVPPPERPALPEDDS